MYDERKSVSNAECLRFAVLLYVLFVSFFLLFPSCTEAQFYFNFLINGASKKIRNTMAFLAEVVFV